MEKIRPSIEEIKDVTIVELSAFLQEYFDVDEEAVESLFNAIYRNFVVGSDARTKGTWTCESAFRGMVRIVKNTGSNYKICGDTIKQFDKQSGTMKEKKILKLYRQLKK